MAAVVITTPSQSSLLFLSKPFLSPARPSSILIRFSSPASLKGRFVTAVAADKPNDLIEVEIGGGGGGGAEGGEGVGGGGGGDSNSGWGGKEDESEGGSEEDKKMSGMSLSQKLTLGYAAFLGVGGVMGYMKSGSRKLLQAGGMSSLLLCYVYTQLPVRPAFASALGLGFSVALLADMGSRIKKSGKIFPEGVVSFVSFIMVGSYFHGLLRSMLV